MGQQATGAGAYQTPGCTDGLHPRSEWAAGGNYRQNASRWRACPAPGPWTLCNGKSQLWTVQTTSLTWQSCVKRKTHTCRFSHYLTVLELKAKSNLTWKEHFASHIKVEERTPLLWNKMLPLRKQGVICNWIELIYSLPRDFVKWWIAT